MRARFHRAVIAAWAVNTAGVAIAAFAPHGAAAAAARSPAVAPAPSPKLTYPIAEGYVETNGVWIYYKAIGRGHPLVILHGGPGASHDYLLPHLIPLARQNRLVFIDERASGRSPALENPSDYTIEKMVEQAGLFGRGKVFERERYPAEYMTASWGEGYFPYLYGGRPDPNFDPLLSGILSWELYRTMWGSHGEFVIDGNLVSVEYEDRLDTISVPTLITVGDHDQCDPSLSRKMQELIPGSKLVVLPESGHMTFVDQPALFVKAVDEFLHPSR